jgi:hypothetical protein
LPFARAVPIALLLALAAPAVADADATLSVTGTAPHKTLTFTVNDALGDHVGAIADDHLVIDDSRAVPVVGSGCTAIDAQTVDCGPAADFERVVFAFGGGDDRLVLYGGFQIDAIADGGAGNDVLDGGQGNDRLSGGPGDDELGGLGGDDELIGGDGDDHLDGYGGEDTFDAGAGDDLIGAGDFPPAADAAISCGPGLDAIVEDDVDDLPDDCEALEPPFLDGGVSITGDPQVGKVLALSLPENVGGDAWATIQWERCDSWGYSCTDIDGANAATYTVTGADVGARVRAWYWVENPLGDDSTESAATTIVRAAPTPPTSRPPRPTVPRPPAPRVSVPTFVIPPLVTVRKPYFALPNGDPVVDTGRTVLCPGATGGVPCRLKVTARPSGASARWRGRPASAGETSVLLAAGRPGRVRVPLNLRAYRLLRAHHKLTLSVTATITRPHSKLVRSTFTITVRTPAHKRR